MHELMTGEKYVLPKIDEKKAAKKEKATLREVKEEDEKETEEKEKKKKENIAKDSGPQTQGNTNELRLSLHSKLTFLKKPIESCLLFLWVFATVIVLFFKFFVFKM